MKKKKIDKSTLKIIQAKVKNSEYGYLTKNEVMELQQDLNMCVITLYKELIKNKIVFQSGSSKLMYKCLGIETDGKSVLFDEIKNMQLNKLHLVKNCKTKILYKCEICNQNGKSKIKNLLERVYFKMHPICSKCILKQVTNSTEWKEKNSKAQLIAQNKPEQIELNRQRQLEIRNEPNFRKRLSEISKEVWKRPGHLEKMKNIAKNKWENEEYALKVIKNCRNGGYNGFYKDIFYQSSYELAYILKIESEQGISSIKRANISIKYNDKNNVERRYLPDFILNDCYLIEIKGMAYWIDLENLKLKNKFAKKWCKQHNLNYRVITDKDIDNFYLNSAKKYIRSLNQNNEIKK